MQAGEESVVLQTPYIICNDVMYDALAQAAGGSARVQIITIAPQSGANPWGCTDYLNHKNDILETGVSVCEWSGDHSMHTKGILIDGNISIIGSFNWDMRSTYLDTEMMLVVDCPALNAVLRREANEMVRQSRTILPDGSTADGSEYIEPALPLTKKMAQALLRIVIRPFRYVL